MNIRTSLYLLMTAAPVALLAGVAQSQTTVPPPQYLNADQNGVDLTTGKAIVTIPEGSIGDPDGGITLTRSYGIGDSVRDNWSGALYRETVGNVSRIRVEFGAISDLFSINGSTYTASKADGATLVEISGGYRYTGRDGTVIDYRSASDLGLGLRGTECSVAGSPTCSIPTLITRPNGMRFTLSWEILEREANCGQQQLTTPSSTDPKADTAMATQAVSAAGCNRTSTSYYRLLAINSSAGYGVSFGYETPGVIVSAPPSTWYKRTSAHFTNSQASCGSSCPSISYGYPAPGQTTITDALGRQWRFGATSTGVAIKRPGSSSDSTTYTMNGTTGLTVANEIGNWTYSWSDSGTTRTMNVSGPAGYSRQIISDMTKGRPISDKDPNGNKTSYAYDTAGRLTRITAPELNYTEYSYDSRGNVTATLSYPKGGGAPITTSAGYDTGCASSKICNQPIWTRDARGAQTDYAYEGAFGGATVITMPAGGNGVRPQLRNYYANLPGTDGQSVWKLTLAAMCQTTASCPGTGDETRRWLVFDGSGGNNMLPLQTLADAGDGSTASRTTLSYDAAGNTIRIDGPLAGSADTTRIYYDAARQMVGSIGPDPDGAGAKRSRAIRYSYNADGQVTAMQRGSSADQSDGALAAAQIVDATYSSYAANGQKITDAQAGSDGQYYAVTNYSYDGLGRLDCIAQRLNPATMNTPPGACSLTGAGSFGSDRIIQNRYDAGGRLTSTDTGVGTADARVEVRTTYTPNGNVSSVRDAKGNVTSYNYDGFDRLESLYYPDRNNGAGPSASDFEIYHYDANSNLIDRRLRDGQMLRYTYDALNRLTLADYPGTNVAETDHMFGYDNLGRLIEARDQNGWYSAFAYDAQSHVVRQSSNVSSNTLQYDEAGRRIRQAWADGFFVNYDYFVTGELNLIRENGGYGLVGFAYDDLGRPTSRGNNGIGSYYAYDAASRLSGLQINLAGTAADLMLGFSFNPAGQITTRTASNDLYAYTGAYDVNRGYSTNGLNQYTASGQIAPSYDTRGNLTQAGTQTFQYNTRNQLFADGSNNLFYRNPLGLLNHLIARGPGTTTNFDYVGSQLAGEYDGNTGALKRRYVFDPTGGDTPLVQYEGSGTNGRIWLHADERGSIIALSDQSGNPVAINSYDEYGIPAAGNAGRFQYTGQMWIPELGMYDYKARVYSPTLGRFLQPDPIGYGDGMNLYAYVGGDPVNHIDPWGLDAIIVPGRRQQSGPLIKGGTNNDLSDREYDERRNQELIADSCSADPSQSICSNSSPQNDPNEIIVAAYWRRQQQQGNPIARLGLQFCWSCSSDFLVSRAKEILMGGVMGTPSNGRYPTAKQGLTTYGRIRSALMYADQAARAADKIGVPGLLSAGQVYDYHVAVFGRFGISSNAFGGSPYSGSRFEAVASASAGVWCAGCDR